MTPKQKAKKLKVPLLPFVPRMPRPIAKKKDDGKELLHKMMDETVSVCECGKEIKRYMRKEPCGRNDCPFGELSNIQLCANQ